MRTQIFKYTLEDMVSMTKKQDKDASNDTKQRAKNNPNPFAEPEPVKAQSATTGKRKTNL